MEGDRKGGTLKWVLAQKNDNSILTSSSSDSFLSFANKEGFGGRLAPMGETCTFPPSPPLPRLLQSGGKLQTSGVLLTAPASFQTCGLRVPPVSPSQASFPRR